MTRLWRRHPLLILAFALALAATLFFATRIVVRTIYWANPAHHNQMVEGWMTVGYIARSWHVDPRALDDLAKLSPDTKGQPLLEIARDRGLPVRDLISDVTAALTELRAKSP